MGTYLCYDVLSDRYFRSNIDEINDALGCVGAKLLETGHACANDFYSEIGLAPVEESNFEWRKPRKHKSVEVSFDSFLSSDGEGCLSVDIRGGLRMPDTTATNISWKTIEAYLTSIVNQCNELNNDGYDVVQISYILDLSEFIVRHLLVITEQEVNHDEV